ncbi:MAG TPA: sigma 54-interacting transcriptional regulator [Myxococcaceae bacterium]|nr:sigma 54-interacting transcriptional regulator [Myxococcaceae bacterium]
MPELVFFRRGDEVLRFTLERPRVVLGRGEKSDVVIPDPDISRQQVALTREGERVRLEDLSGKGTLVGGAPVREAFLADGADIALGQWRAVYREHASSDEDKDTRLGGTRTEQQPRDPSTRRWQAAQLRVRRGAEETVHRFTGEVIALGKDPENDLVLDDPFVSGKHVKFIRREGAFQIIDNRSTNGTWHGAVRLYDAEVPIGTALRVGESEIFLEPLQRKEPAAFQGIIGADPALRQLSELIERVAPSSAAIAIFGESGTGKELVARAIHDRSARAGKAFIPVNCAAISRELIESELFGHEKGAFTGAAIGRTGAFEEADGGTLFLDEIGELPLELQAKLLRALESGEIKRVGASRPGHVDVRVVTATNRDLLQAVNAGDFREDLYYRLCVIPLHLPPLRRRKGDVVALAEHFLRAFSPRGQDVKMTQAAVERLQRHHWPGNVRELRNVVHRALLLRRGPMIDAGDIAFDQELNTETGIALPGAPSGLPLDQMLLKLERQIVENALRRHQHNRERAARELGIARSTLFKRLREWGLTGADETE